MITPHAVCFYADDSLFRVERWDVELVGWTGVVQIASRWAKWVEGGVVLGGQICPVSNDNCSKVRPTHETHTCTLRKLRLAYILGDMPPQMLLLAALLLKCHVFNQTI